VSIFCADVCGDSIRYTVTDLGTLGGGWSTARKLNEAGQVVGRSRRTAGGDYYAFVWDESNGMQDISAIVGEYWPGYQGPAINDAGTVVVGRSVSGQKDAMVWNPGTGLYKKLPALSGHYYDNITTFDINNDGRVAGNNHTGLSGVGTPVYWDPDYTTITPIPMLPGANWTGSAAGVNNKGEMVGQVWETWPTGGTRAFFWSETTGTVEIGQLPDTDQNLGWDVNESGQVIGMAYDSADSSIYKSFYWDLTNQQMIDLGVPAGFARSALYGINDAGLAAGRGYDGAAWHGVLWGGSDGWRNVNTMLDSGSSGWQIGALFDVNNQGWLVGHGLDPASGEWHAVLLQPAAAIPEPSIAVLLGLGMLATVIRR
jgi:probable HAF family extracellular repeat protein